MLENPNTLIGIVSLLFSGIIGLMVYVWKQKDKQGELINEKLDNILVGINSSNVLVAELKKDVTTHYKEIELLRKKASLQTTDISEMKSDLSTLMEFKRNLENK